MPGRQARPFIDFCNKIGTTLKSSAVRQIGQESWGQETFLGVSMRWLLAEKKGLH
jgi:hypothetical protein